MRLGLVLGVNDNAVIGRTIVILSSVLEVELVRVDVSVDPVKLSLLLPVAALVMQRDLCVVSYIMHLHLVSLFRSNVDL